MSPTCRCGHDREAHQHYRPGSDCGVCGYGACPYYLGPGVARHRVRQLLDRVGLGAFALRAGIGLLRDHGRTPRR